MIKVILFGPECSGKTTLAHSLADHYQTEYVPEYLRTFVEVQQRLPMASDSLHIMQNQLACEEACSSPEQEVLICDTNPLSTLVYHKFYFGSPTTEMEQFMDTYPAHHYFLTHPDIPWIADGQRDQPLRRAEIFDLFRNELLARGLSFTAIQGAHADRFRTAQSVINSLISSL